MFDFMFRNTNADQRKDLVYGECRVAVLLLLLGVWFVWLFGCVPYCCGCVIFSCMETVRCISSHAAV